LFAAKQMQMEVRHFLTAVLAVVGQHPVAARRKPELPRHRTDRAEETSHFGIGRARRKIIHRDICPLGDHQHMRRGLRVNVMEGEGEIVLKHLFARHFATQNSGKNVLGIVHMEPAGKQEDEMQEETLILPPEWQGQRLDKALQALLPALSRTRLQDLIRQGAVRRMDGQPLTDPSGKVACTEVILCVPEAAPTHIEAQEIPLHILYEDDALLVLDKPAGLVVHPAPGNPDQTLVNALLAHCGDSLTGIGGEKRPGIVHRLDKDTSGVMVVAKTAAAHADLVSQFQARSIERSYLALVWGRPVPPSGLIEGNIGRHPHHRKKMAVLRTGGREAATRYETLAPHAAVTLLRCQLLTGRTHQIRVHLSHQGYPLVGDPVYSRQNRGSVREVDAVLQALRGFPRQALHAETLGFVHPLTRQTLRFRTAPPTDFEDLLRQVALAS
jgi:23S rRNA pseudouridine1911/1915/1917 synthase